jgi:hypothetical protein
VDARPIQSRNTARLETGVYNSIVFGLSIYQDCLGSVLLNVLVLSSENRMFDSQLSQTKNYGIIYARAVV